MSIFIIDREAYFKWHQDQDFQTYYQIENITDTLILSIQFNPPVTQSMYILYIPSEDSSFHRELRITYTFFHSNYGFFFLSAILLFSVGDVSQSIPFFVLSIIKLLQGFNKRKAVIWQKLLILIDIFFINWIIHIVGELIYLNYYELRIITNFLSILFLFYVYYDIYTFMTLRHKKELYLKELSIVDRLRKKESMLHDTISNSISNTQKISSTKNTFSLVIEERIDIFLKKAKKKLPLWLKISEKREVLNEIEEEIREHVQEFEESNKRTEENLNQLFSEFEIYISNEKWPWDVETTPKIYISKELWS